MKRIGVRCLEKGSRHEGGGIGGGIECGFLFEGWINPGWRLLNA